MKKLEFGKRKIVKCKLNEIGRSHSGHLASPTCRDRKTQMKKIARSKRRRKKIEEIKGGEKKGRSRKLNI